MRPDSDDGAVPAARWTAIAWWFTPQSEACQAAVREPDGQLRRPWSLEGATAPLTISVSTPAFSAWITPKKHVVTPAILIGLFGYMIGTFVALAVAAVLR